MVCKHYMQGRCNHDNCRYLHDPEAQLAYQMEMIDSRFSTHFDFSSIFQKSTSPIASTGTVCMVDGVCINTLKSLPKECFRLSAKWSMFYHLHPWIIHDLVERMLRTVEGMVKKRRSASTQMCIFVTSVAMGPYEEYDFQEIMRFFRRHVFILI